MANPDYNEITPERLLLSAIVRTMKPQRRFEVLAVLGDTKADNIINIRAPHDQRKRNELIKDAWLIAGVKS